jgi:DnaK suppressor protein
MAPLVSRAGLTWINAPAAGVRETRFTITTERVMNEVTHLIEKLRSLRTEMAERLQRIRNDRRRVEGPVSADFKEQVVERENDEVLAQLEDTTAADLRQMEHALSRVDAGLYPLCETCGDRIEMDRLRALPFATTCRVCVARSDTEALLERKKQAHH